MQVVIIDLGVAEMFSVADPAGRMIGGTPTTMAPEVHGLGVCSGCWHDAGTRECRQRQVWMGTFGPKCDVGTSVSLAKHGLDRLVACQFR